MSVGFKSTFRKHWPALGRRVGVFVCLLALTVVVFGHREDPAEASVGIGQAVITQGHGGSPADHENAAIGYHCAHLGQCSVHAVLPPAAPADCLGTPRQRPAAIRLAEGRTISPLRHPPKLRAVL